MAKEWFRAFGVLTLLFEAAVLISPFTPRARLLGPLPPLALVRLAAFAAVATAVGFGLIYLRKWAAALFAVASSSAGAWLIAASLPAVPLPWVLINIAIGVALLLPAAAVVQHWSLLSWGRRRLR